MKQEPKRRKIRLSGGDRVFVTVNSAILILLFLLIIYPIIFVMSASISAPIRVNAGEVILLPKDITFEGYKRIFAAHDIWVGYANTIFYTLVGTTLNLLATLPCAYGLSRRDVPFRNVVMTMFMITMYFSGGLIPSYLNVKELGLLHTRTILLIGGLVSAYNVIVSRTFFSSSIPWELHEAAIVDGASDFTMFVRIVLPLSKAIIAVMALYYGVGHWNSYFNAMIYLDDRSKYPLQLFLREILIKSQLTAAMMGDAVDTETALALSQEANAANQIKYGVIIVSTVPMLALYPWLQKFFAKGVMIGSVKG